MALLVLSLILFIGLHLIRVIVPAFRQQMIDKLVPFQAIIGVGLGEGCHEPGNEGTSGQPGTVHIAI